MLFDYRRFLTVVLTIFCVVRLNWVACNEDFAKIFGGVNENADRVESLRKVNFLVGIAERVVNGRNESSEDGEVRVHVLECIRDLRMFLEAIETNKIWAIKLTDAFGNMPRSFVWGNNFWFSPPELCNDIHDPYYISLSSDIPRASSIHLMNTTSPYKMHLQMVYFNYTSTLQLDLKQQYQPYIEIGLCVPDSCPQDAITSWTNEYFKERLYGPQVTYGINMSTISSKLPGFKPNIFASVGLILLLLIGLAILIFTILAEIVQNLRQRRMDISKTAAATMEPVYGENFFMCFSLRENYPRVMQATAPKDFVPVIAGMRTIVCVWVTLLHIYYHSMFTRSNVQFLYAKLESFILQPVLQACFYVDVFFTISGFLLVYNLLSNAQQVEKIRTNPFLQNVKLYLQFVFHRHFRLMPLFIVTMMASDFVYDLVDMASPFYVNGENDLYCKETWWYNLLYINNAIPLSKMCASWGWYIACEMQFYLFFLAIIFIYIKSENVGKTLFSVSMVVFISVSYYCYYSNGITFQIDVISTTIENVYIKPWTRITPYFSGVFMGWVLYQNKDSAIKLKSPVVNAFWILAVVMMFVTAFMTYWKYTPVWIVSTIMSFGKLIFGIFIGSLISLCQLGYGGGFAKFMGSKSFLYLNKFSFGMYMIAPMVITILFGLRTEASYFNELSAVSDILAVLLFTHFFSILATLFIELPFQRLSSQFILKRA